MKSDVKRDLEKELKRYALKEIRIQEKKYPLYLVPELCDEDLNIFEGFLFVEAENKSEVSYLKTKYRPPVSGYTPRIGIILYEGHLLIKDYRRNKHIIKTIRKINKTFLNKLKKALSEPKEENLNKLFDRTDVIEEFYILYKKAREYLLKNISGIPEEEKREEFVDNFMMQMLTLWYLQERGFFNNDKNYFITKFKEFKQKKLFNDFKSYYEFLTHLFEKISGNLDSQYYEDKITGKVVVIGPAVFLNGEHSRAISISDKCFYKEDLTDILINTAPKKVSQEVPLLNLFESRDWTEGNIDEFVLGAIYEKLITYMERKKLGAYYTPEEITSYICENTIKPYLVDRINEKFGKKFETLDQIIESNDKEIILYIFEQLKEIKILDPAVGSAHFLESAINVLVSIYEKIWNKAKELGMRKGLEIIATDEKGEIKKINLLEIDDEDKFKLLVKFFIILSKNIYGVDINPSALRVAKARLFLTLAKHFKVGKEKDIFIRFPNVHFNLREGNSLIGYVEIGREEEFKHKQPTLFDFGIREEEKIDYITEKIKVVEELKPYLEKTAKSLNLGGDVVKEVKELNKILAKRKIDWNDFKKVLRTKEKLITILIASLNSKYAKPLNDLLNEITNLFNQKLDEKFVEEHKIKLENLKKIKTFHWIFEFPEVFLDKGGFDVVIGNPPYLRQESIGIEKAYFGSLYPEVYEGTADYCVYFVENSLNVLKEKGYHSFIITNKWLRARYGKKLRKYLAKEVSIKKLIDFNGVRVFKGATNDVLIYIIKKSKEEIGDICYSGELSKFTRDIDGAGSVEELVNRNLIHVDQRRLGEEWNLVSKKAEEIKKWIEKNGIKLKDLDVGIYLGIKTGFNEAFIIDDTTRKELIEKDPKSAEIIKPLLRGKDIGRYYIGWDRKYLILAKNGINIPKEYPAIYEHLSQWKDKLEKRWDQGDYWYNLRHCAYYEEFEKPKIVYPDISERGGFSYDTNAYYTNNTTYFIISKNPLYLLCLLNSILINFYFKMLGAQLGSEGLRYFTQYVEQLPIPQIPEFQHRPYEILADYLLFLNTTKERREKLKDTIEFFDRQIADSLVYELYFKEKFHEDGLYKQPKEHLISTVLKHLKPINYDRWAELYWKKQINGNLTEEEQKELEKLEKENMKTVGEVYKALKEDVKVKELIEKIKSHEWVKVIEGEG